MRRWRQIRRSKRGANVEASSHRGHEPAAGLSSRTGCDPDLGLRIHQLQAEARGLVRSHVTQLQDQLLHVGRLAEQIAHGGDLHPPGVRELVQRLKDDGLGKASTLAAIMGRRPD